MVLPAIALIVPIGLAALDGAGCCAACAGISPVNELAEELNPQIKHNA
jgi:hypothetical protein